MKELVTFAAAAVLALIPVSGAWAVDVVNEDEDGYVLFVGQDNNTKEVEIGGKQSLQNICDSCDLVLDEGEPLAVEGDQVVVIKNGKISIRG